jgi:hypothetical protein
MDNARSPKSKKLPQFYDDIVWLAEDHDITISRSPTQYAYASKAHAVLLTVTKV